MRFPATIARAARNLGRVAVPLALFVLLSPDPASAHGLVGRAYLPVPAWLFAWAAGAILVVSFLALGRMWHSPRLAVAPRRRLFSVPTAIRVAAGAAGVTAFALVVIAGISGSQIPTENLAPTAVFVLFWVGVPVASAVLGDVFRAFNPWRSAARGVRWVARRVGLTGRFAAPLPYPERLGRWPAVIGILAFGWVELVFTGRDRPATLAVLAFAYSLAQIVGMALYGIETWGDRGDAFGVVFAMFGRLSMLELRDGVVYRRAPLSGLADARAGDVPGTAALLVAMIGTTTFDGFLNGPVWRGVGPALERDLGGLGGVAALEIVQTAGLALAVLTCAALYWGGVRGMSGVSRRYSAPALARAFAFSLAPIAFGYLLAHYFSLLITQGQATAHLISDPFGTGNDLFGTAGASIDYGIVSAAAIWYVQVAALVGGHVGGLALAHDRALVLYSEPRPAADSQRWMLVVMVSFTCLGLWLLSAVNT